ncbi:unannotated protein [freshwater metagenome]|uniref:Unannotated protein n=1 Tax=freshwater metagenome TaxID=449393 RepID=A0A6J7A5D6_9ZZZZ
MVGGTVVVGGVVVGAELVVDSLIPTEAFSFDGSSDPPELRALATTRSAQATEIPTFQPVSFRLVQRRMSPTGKQKNRPGTIAHQVWYHGEGVFISEGAVGSVGAFVSQAVAASGAAEAGASNCCVASAGAVHTGGEVGELVGAG